MRFSKMIVPALALVFAAGSAAANEFETPLREVAAKKIQEWAKDPAVVAAVKAQNKAHSGLSQGDIDKMDKQWRSETAASAQPMIQKVISNELSKFLKAKKEASQGLYTEIFVMDNKGLNVGQSDVTSDYWQGDEAKWQKTYMVGGDAVHIGGVQKDESTQSFQSQVSVSIVDPANKQVIGAVTVGVDVEQLAQ